jgi:hypothetical protein
LGVILNGTFYTTFDNQSVTTSDVLVKYTYYGDANLDGKVDGSDYSRVDAGFISNGKLTGWANGDFNYDGKINGTDYSLIDATYASAAKALALVAKPQALTADSHPTDQSGKTLAVLRSPALNRSLSPLDTSTNTDGSVGELLYTRLHRNPRGKGRDVYLRQPSISHSIERV